MLTLISHVVFWPALLFNVVYWITIFSIVFFDNTPTRISLKDVGVTVFLAALMFVPGVYLFGIW